MVIAALISVGSVLAGCSTSSTSSGTTTTPSVTQGKPVPSSGCKKPVAASVTDQRNELTVSDTTRWYLLTTPAPSTPSATSPKGTTPIPRPVVVDFHGLSEGATLHSVTAQFGQLGQKDGFIAVYPNGTGTPVQWDVSPTQTPNPDIEFVQALLTSLESNYCVDISRVYASGLSDGAFMVSLLACEMSTRFAAIGAVAGLQLPNPCHPSRKVPLISFHGTQDPILFFNGGIGYGVLNKALGTNYSAGDSASTTTTLPPDLTGKGVPATVQAWAVKDGCSRKFTDKKISSEVIQRTYSCPPNVDIVFYIVLGGGHSWPGSAFSKSVSGVTGFTTFQIKATETMWTFFQRFQLPLKTTP